MCARRESRRLARINVEQEAEERACCDKVAEAEDKAALKSAGSEGWKPSRFSIASIPDNSQRDLEVISSCDRNTRSNRSISEKVMEPQRFDPTALAPANWEKDGLTAKAEAKLGKSATAWRWKREVKIVESGLERRARDAALAVTSDSTSATRG